MKSLYFRILNFDFSIKSAYDFTDLLVPVLKNATRRQACSLKMVAEPILHSELKLFGLNSGETNWPKLDEIIFKFF